MSRLSSRNLFERFDLIVSRLKPLFKVSPQVSSRRRPRSASFVSQSSFQLEARNLLAGIYFDAGSGEVLIGGTNANDTASVEYSGDSVVFKQSGFESETIPKSQVKAVWFVGLDGNDRFENKTSIPSHAYGNNGNDTLIGGTGKDQFGGGDGNDQLIGKDGDDLLAGGRGDDRIDAGNGDDKVYGVSGANVIDVGGGNDLVYGGTDGDTINGGAGNDQLYSNGGDDTVNGGSGNDVIGGHTGDDTLVGGDGNDQLYGGEGSDKLSDAAGDNILAGGQGNDEATGGSGRDTIYGGDGVDLLRGGGNNDVIAGQGGDDTLYGGGGDDSLVGNTGNDVIFGEAGNDVLSGLAGHDVLLGGSGNDSLFGGDHNDDLYGESGTDRLFGERGLDGLFGGVGGRDLLDGGADADRFLIHSGDVLKDFRSSSDVQLKFENSSSSWTNKEIEVLDRGLGKLHRRTGVRVLRNTLDKNELTFYKVSNTSSGNAAQNELQMRYLRDGATGILIPGSEEYTRKITFAEWNESDASQNEFRARAAIHEVAHNWDSEKEINSVMPGQGSQWRTFLSKSNWRSSDPNSSSYTKARGTSFEPFEIQFDPSIKNYRQTPKSWWYSKSAEFARSYGATNPLEDWATMWEAAFAATPDPAVKAKLAVVNKFLATV